MKKKYIFKEIFVFVIIGLFSSSLIAQIQVAQENKTISVNWDVCTYYPDPNPKSGFVERSTMLKKQMDKNRMPCSNFIVNYTGFTSEARDAFQFAVDIWSNSIESTIPIRVNATFGPLDPGVIGSAGPTRFIVLTGGSIPPNTAFPIALAEKLLNDEISEDSSDPNSGPSVDISATFSSDFNFYFGTDGNTPTNQIDFVSVVLHELGHGLGVLGFGRIPTDGNGEPDPNPPVNGVLRNQNFLSIWDQFIENGAAVSISTFADPSATLLSEFESNSLFSNGPIAIGQNGGLRPPIFAPSTFEPGSSYSHWDEPTYPSGDPNSLMTPSIGRGEAIQDPGLVTLGFMEDMGWSICGGTLTIEEFETNSIEISPNPFVSSISVRLANNQNDNYRINLIDINGRIILTENKTSNDNIITLSNLSNLNDALYFIKITNKTNGTSITKKVIKN